MRETVDPVEMFLTCYSKDIVRTAAHYSHQEWLALSGQITSLANELASLAENVHRIRPA
jgi:hypothetical protein